MRVEHHRPMTDDRRRTLSDYDQMAAVYANDADVDPIKTAYDRPTILSMAGDVTGKRVLDVGCASGGLSALFLERGADVVAVDLNPALVTMARARLGDRATVHEADIAQPMPFLESD
jgi:SAM-dependent methyltransferase